MLQQVKKSSVVPSLYSYGLCQIRVHLKELTQFPVSFVSM